MCRRLTLRQWWSAPFESISLARFRSDSKSLLTQRIDQSRSYSVRARIMVGQQLLFTTDQAYPVLTRGHDNEVQIMRMVRASKPASKPAQAAPLGTLPASFIGELPCADCPGIRYHVNLFADRVFFCGRRISDALTTPTSMISAAG